MDPAAPAGPLGAAAPGPRAAGLALAALLLLAAGLRLYGLDFGLPQTGARPDERRIVGLALRIVQGDPNPHFFRYPSLYLYLLAGVYALYLGLGRIAGRFESAGDLVAEFAVDPTRLLLLDRALSAGFGVASVALAYALGRRLAGRGAGLGAALLLAVAPLHVRDSHFGVTDVTATALALAAVLLALRAHERGRARDWAACGAAAGLAASTKYFGIFVAGAWLASEVARRLAGGPGIAPARSALRPALGRGLAFAAAAGLAFLLGTPFALLDAGAFRADLGYEIGHLERGHRVALGPGWWRHLRFSLPHGLGGPVFAAGLLGLPLLVRRAPGRAAVVLAFPLLYLAVAGRGQSVFARYALPLLPFLCLSAAVAAGWLAAWIARPLGPRGRAAVAVGVPLLLAAPSLACALRADALLAREDNRLVAARWLRQHLPAGASVYHTGSKLARLELPVALEELARPAPEESPFQRAVREARLARQRQSDTPGFATVRYHHGSERFEIAGRPRALRPDYVVVQRSPLRGYSRVPEALPALLAADYRRVATFPTGAEALPEWRYDPQDAFFAPFVCGPAPERPGPGFEVYARRP